MTVSARRFDVDMRRHATSGRYRFATLRWIGGVDGHLRLIDQTLLADRTCRDRMPRRARRCGRRSARCASAAPRPSASRRRTACAWDCKTSLTTDEATFFARLHDVADDLATSRPTAVNLFWALERMKRLCRERCAGKMLAARNRRQRCWPKPRRFDEEDRAMCRAIGRHGAELLADGQGVLTHCNAGGLATADYGTALAVFFAAHEAGKAAARLCRRNAAAVARRAAHGLGTCSSAASTRRLICDSMAAQVMREGRVQAVVVGADRIAANGDTANKIGTYGVAVLAAAHDIPFYVAAPSSTFDLSLAERREHSHRAAAGRRNHPRLRPANGARRESRSTTRRSTSLPQS